MLTLLTSSLLALVTKSKRGGIIINEHTLTRAQTRLHARALGKYFDFIRLEQLPLRLTRPQRRPFCLLTFDDGKRSNASESAPELERLGIPAVFYVTTNFLSQGRALWFDRRKALLRALGYCPAGLELQALKRLPLAVLNERLERACAQHRINPELESDDVRPMSWEEARGLSRRGFVIGAHGCTHGILTCETRQTAFAEIEESLRVVSSQLDSPCSTFAFPNGNYTTELAQHAVHCGARTIMTTEPMWTDVHSRLSALPRIQLFGQSTPSRIELKLALSAVRGVLANPNGTGRAYRCSHRREAPQMQPA